ncbi:MAG: thioredoxin family protein [Candidatus Sungbacteria bacterium]|nr:thioredoxin family protein [Candidatus Sungbacteria bacterium]
MCSVKIVAGVIVLVILGAGGWFFLSDRTDGTMMKKDDAAMEKSNSEGDSAMMEKDEGAMMEKGSYEPYSAEKLARASEGKVVLFFRAPWCPTCRALDANIRANLGNIPSDLTILDVDYDSSTALKQKYGVTYQHTFVQVDTSGNQITKWASSPTLAELITHLK